MYKVLFHVDEVNKWDLTIANVKNIITSFINNNEEFHIIVVGNSKAVETYLEKELIEKIISFDLSKVSFKACSNALRVNNIKEEQLIKSIEVVSSGVYYIAKMQTDEGYIYIRP